MPDRRNRRPKANMLEFAIIVVLVLVLTGAFKATPGDGCGKTSIGCLLWVVIIAGIVWALRSFGVIG